MIDPACPFDTHIEKKEEEKCTNYSERTYEQQKNTLRNGQRNQAWT